jgi:hypothetical protein
MRINLSKERATKRPWIKDLARGFAEAYDIKFTVKVLEYLATPAGSKAFAAWLKSDGFRAEYWCLEPLISVNTSYGSTTKTTEYLAFGVIIQDDCPRLIEIKLRNA